LDIHYFTLNANILFFDFVLLIHVRLKPVQSFTTLLSNTKFCVIFIFILASIFRIFFLDNIEFKYDEAFGTYQIVDFYNHPRLIEIGGMSYTTGTSTAPLTIYLLIFMSFISQHPQTTTFFIALTSSIAVAVFYLLTRRVYGNTVALLTSLIIATSPWAILYSRKIWPPDLLMPFLVPISYFVSQIILKYNVPIQKYFFWLFFLLALTAQIHDSGAVLFVVTVIILVVLKIKIDVRSSLKGFGVGLIPLLPYIIRQFKSNPFCIDCQALFNYHTVQESTRSFQFLMFKIPFSLERGVSGVLGEDYSSFLLAHPVVSMINTIFALEGLLIFLALIWITTKNRKYLFLVLYPFLATFIYFAGRSNPYDYYLLIIYPFLLLAVGLFFKSLLDIKSYFVKIPVLTIFTIMILSNIIFEISFNKFLAEKKVINSGYGQIFSVTEEYVNKIVEPYKYQPDYEQIKAYAYIFANNRELHPKLNDEAEHIKLGEYFAQSGRLELAIRELQMGIEVNPDNPSTRAVLAQVFMQTKQFDKAKDQIKIISIQDKGLADQLNSKLETIESTAKLYKKNY